MGALAGLDDLVNRATGGNSGTPENIWWSKIDRIAGTSLTNVQHRELSLWNFDGHPGAAPTPPTSATVCDVNTDGAMKQANPGGGRQKWLTSFGCWYCSAQATLILYDRLLHISGLSGTVTTAQAVGGTLTRYATTESWGNQAWVEVYSPLGATGTTLSMTYTNEQGTSGQVSSALTPIGNASFSEQGRMWQIPLANGDQGLRAVQDVTLTATTGTAGNFGITILRPLAIVHTGDFAGGGDLTYIEQINEIKTDACLALMVIPHIVVVPRFAGSLGMVEA